MVKPRQFCYCLCRDIYDRLNMVFRPTLDITIHGYYFCTITYLSCAPSMNESLHSPTWLSSLSFFIYVYVYISFISEFFVSSLVVLVKSHLYVCTMMGYVYI